VTRNPPESVATNVALPDMPVAVDARVVLSFGVVEVNRSDILRSHRQVKCLDRCFQTILLAYIIAGSEGVCGVEADT
jgi:hypothetical protein